ncbi:MAG: tRNA epoxyqueuosine(34) reductase QueG [Gemmatimonadaceae bacterium]
MTAAAVSLEQRIKDRARELGFDPVGITALGPSETHDTFVAWIEKGYAGNMAYLARGAEKRRDTRLPFPGVKSAIVVGLDYGGREPSGPVARYARGDDYHDIMVERLGTLHRWIESELGASITGKAYVDTGPILERELAQRAGLGWIGKNTMLVNPRRGSWFFIGALLLDLELTQDAPFDADRCGTCTRCIDACPTDAIVSPRELDARRCISYLTIEHRGEIHPALHPLISDHVYGCDICQDVCPWNVSFALSLEEPRFRPRAALAGKDAAQLSRDLLAADDEEFRRAYRSSPMKRAKLDGLRRNAAIVLENTRLGAHDAGIPLAAEDGTA